MKLNKKLDTLAESATIRLNSEAKALQDQGIKIFNLTVGELDFETPKPIQAAVRKCLSQNKYTPTLGLLELRTSIAKDVSRIYRWPVTKANIAVTAGAKQALYNIFQIICNPGDEVLIPTPSWVSYEHQVTLAGGKSVFVPLSDTFDLDVPALKRALTRKTKAIIINSPHNPTGAVFTQKSLRALAKMLKRKDIIIVADDIYQSLLYTKAYAPVTTVLRERDRLIIVNGFSKSYALTGWRIGYMVAHPDIIEANNRLQSHSSGNASILSQRGALASFQHVVTPAFVKVLARRKKTAEEILRAIPNIKFIAPKGAFYFFVDIRKVERDTVRWCEKLLQEEGVAVVPGEAFRCPGYVRISFACGEKDLVTALRRIRRFTLRYSNI